MKNKIHCICPCCRQKVYVDIETFNSMQRFALKGLHETVEVLPEEDKEKE